MSKGRTDKRNHKGINTTKHDGINTANHKGVNTANHQDNNVINDNNAINNDINTINTARTGSNYAKHYDFMLADILILTVCYFLVTAAWFRLYHHYVMPEECRNLGIIVFLVSVFVNLIHSFYSGILRRGNGKEWTAVLTYVSVIWIISIFMVFLLKMRLVSRPAVVLSWGSACILVFVFRTSRKKALLKKLSVKENLEQVVLVTDRAHFANSFDQLNKNAATRYAVKAVFLTDQRPEEKDYHGAALFYGTEKQVCDYVLGNVVDRVNLDIEDQKLRSVLMDDLTLMGVQVSIPLLRDLPEMPNEQILNYNGDIYLCGSISYATPQQKMIKRAVDILGALVGLVFAGIFTVIFGPIIYFQSPGSIFYGQERVGINGRKFKIWKFRTMYPNADKDKAKLMAQNKVADGFMFKMDNDPRVIPIGRFLRRHSIDEFPQFFNVLRNDMSLVGTRPPTVGEYEKYNYNHRARLSIKPGLTGMWQVSGRSTITNFDEVVALDVKYIREWSLGLDIKILWKTVAGIFRPEGAE